MAKKQTKNPAVPEKPKTEVNQYDKVFKETVRAQLPALLTDILSLPAGAFEPVHIEFQRTIERKADFVGKLKAEGLPDTIVQLEAQTGDDPRMVFRLHFYCSLILHQYPECELEQIVLFLGQKRPAMTTSLRRGGLDFRFRLVWIKDIPYRDFLRTGKPELVLMGVLADHGDQTAEAVMTEVVNELHRLTPKGVDRELRLQQLHLLSNLHNLQQIFGHIMQNISEVIDERKDPFFQRGEKIGFEKGIEKGIEKGREEGREEGIEKGREEGREEGLLVAVEKILLKFPHFSDAEVADIFQLPVERIAAIRMRLAGKDA